MRPIDPQKQQLEDEIKKNIQTGVPIAPELMEYAKSIFPTLQNTPPLPENYNALAEEEAGEQNPLPENYGELAQEEASTQDNLPADYNQLAQDEAEQQDNFSESRGFEKTPEQLRQYRDKMRAAYPYDSSFAEPEQPEQVASDQSELSPELKDYAYNIFPSLEKIVPRRQQTMQDMPTQPEKVSESIAPKQRATEARKQFSKAVEEVSPEIASKTVPAKIAETEEDDISKIMKQAEEKEKSAKMDLAVAKFRDAVMGAGGTGYKSDLSQYERAIKDARKPITDYETKLKLIEARDQINDKKAKNDPSSGISQMLRQSLSDIGVKMDGFENVSYSQLEKIYPSLANAAATKIAADARKIEAVARKEEVAQNKLDKLDLINQRNAIGHIDFSMRQLSKPYQEYEQGISQIDSANKIIENVRMGKISPGMADVTALYTLVKGLDPSSAVREGEIALSKQAMSLWGRIYAGTKGSISGGDLLDTATRKSIQEILKAIQATREKSFGRQKAALVQAGVGKGIDKAVLEGSIYPEVKSQKQAKSGSEDSVKFSKNYKPGSTITLKDDSQYVVQEDGVTGVKK